MFRVISVFLVVLVLTGCQSVPTISQDYDKNQSFAQYKYYVWNMPKLQYQPDDVRIKSDLTEERIVEAVNHELNTKGIVLVDKTHPARFTVKAYLIVENRTEQFNDWSVWGGYWGSSWGVGPGYNHSSTIHYSLATLQLDFIDTANGKLIWRGSGIQAFDFEQSQTPEQREAVINKTVAGILKQYPPTAF